MYAPFSGYSYMTNVSDSVLAGALSGVFTRLLGSPLDVIKVRMQLQIEPTSTIQVSRLHTLTKACGVTVWCYKSNQVIYNDSKYRGLFHAARTIFREEGVRAFWCVFTLQL